MIAYKFYVRNVKGNFEYIGSLPDRRRNTEKITDGCSLRWGRKYFDTDANARKEDIFFVETVLPATKG